VLTSESSTLVEAFSSARLCFVCATVYLENINLVDGDICGFIRLVLLVTPVLAWEHCNPFDASSPVGAVCSFVLPLECNTCLLSNVTVYSHT
jgi:hypothetical protein